MEASSNVEAFVETHKACKEQELAYRIQGPKKGISDVEELYFYGFCGYFRIFGICFRFVFYF